MLDAQRHRRVRGERHELQSTIRRFEPARIHRRCNRGGPRSDEPDKSRASPAQESGEALAAAAPPNADAMAMEGDIPAGYSSAEAGEYFVKRPGSDFMVDVIKSLNLEYITTNPGSSFRGIHESIVNYGGNSQPELLTCPHEEQAVAVAHGYAKVAGKPIGVLCHGTVGLQHAAMAVYNAWCDRVPMVILGGNHLDVTDRRTGAEWSHSAQDAVRVLRDYIKWDDTPVSLPHFSESMARAYKIATTPPMGPVAVTLDGHLQEYEMAGESPTIARMSPTEPPIGDAAALEEAARWLVEAESPVIAVDLMAHDQQGVENLVALAEALQAPVVNQFGRMNFPNTHYLSQGAGAVAQADVILGLELFDTWGLVNTLRDRVHKDAVRRARPDARVIDIGVKDLFMRSNYQSFQRFHPSDLSIAGDAQATLPSLLEEVERQMSRSRRSRKWGPRTPLARGACADAPQLARCGALRLGRETDQYRTHLCRAFSARQGSRLGVRLRRQSPDALGAQALATRANLSVAGALRRIGPRLRCACERRCRACASRSGPAADRNSDGRRFHVRAGRFLDGCASSDSVLVHRSQQPRLSPGVHAPATYDGTPPARHGR